MTRTLGIEPQRLVRPAIAARQDERIALRKPCACAGAAWNANTRPSKDMLDTMIAAGHYTALANAANAARLTDHLEDKCPYTVFAPTDAAFKKIPTGGYDSLLKDVGKLKAILNYHV